MGYMIATSTCFGCKRLFSYNPNKVPSYAGNAICADCIAIVNKRREDAGLPLWPVAADAYAPEEVA
jgi:hypothetical protein